MGRGNRSRLIAFLVLADLALVALSFVLAVILRSTLSFGRGGPLERGSTAFPAYVYLVALPCWGIALASVGAYNLRRVLRWYAESAYILLGSVIAMSLVAAFLYMTNREASRLQFLYAWVLSLAFLHAYRGVLRVYYRITGEYRPGWRVRILIVGAGDLGQRLARVLRDYSRWGFHLVGYLDDDPAKLGRHFVGGLVLGDLDGLPQAVRNHQVDEVWLTLPGRAQERINQAVAATETFPVRVSIVPDYASLALVRAKTSVLGGIPLIGLREPIISDANRVIKRVFDLLGGSLFLLLLALPMGVIALLIRLGSAGPILFRQKRVGENSRLFDMLKFRTMVAEAEQLQEQVLVTTENGQVIHKHKDDPRVTRIGRFLRRYSLDELPQLFNVLRGEMSMVGPRPEMPWLVDKYEPWQRKRFAVPQGITGWWQINGRSDKPMHLSTDNDLYYVYNYSLWLDIWILLRTPWAVITSKGAF